MVAARRRSASSGPLRGLQRHVRRRARSCVQSNLPAMPTIGEGGLIPPISGQSQGTGWLPEPLRGSGLDDAPNVPSEDSGALPEFLIGDDGDEAASEEAGG